MQALVLVFAKVLLTLLTHRAYLHYEGTHVTECCPSVRGVLS